MKSEGAKHEAIRILYHLWGESYAQIASMFGMKRTAIRLIVLNRNYATQFSPARRYDLSCADVLSYIAQNGPISRQGIQSAYGLPNTSILRRLTALQRQGAIVRDGRKYMVVS